MGIDFTSFNKYISIKNGASKELFEDLEKYDKVLLITTPEIVSLFEKEFEILNKKSYITIEYMQDYSLKEAERINNIVLKKNLDTILAVGGGTVSDTAKLAAFMSNKKLVLLPTIISNDGLCSPISVLKNDNGYTEGINSKSPDSIYVDIDIIKKSPLKYIEAGLCDILSNYSALFDWKLAVKNNKEEEHSIAEILSSVSFWNLFNLPNDLDEDLFIKLVTESIILSGISMELKGNTRPCSGSEHLFNHAVVRYYPKINILHGYLVGLGSLSTAIFQKQNFEKIISFLKKYKIDLRPSKLGISKEIFVDSWIKAKDMRPDRYTILNEIELTKEKLNDVYDKIEKESY